MKKHIVALILVLTICLCACGKNNDNQKGDDTMGTYKSITMEEAKEIFAGSESGYIILDVRTPDEFVEGHIPGAINVANESIVDKEPTELPDKTQVIYVYCRSGNRSKQAAGKLANMGYENIIEFGGIMDWRDRKVGVDYGQ